MYGAGGRSFDRGGPRTYGPPNRRSRSPVGFPPERYGYPDRRNMDPPPRGPPTAPPYYRGPKMNDPEFSPRPGPDIYDSYDFRPPYEDVQGNGYYPPPRRMNDQRMDRSPRFDRRPMDFDRREGKGRYGMPGFDDGYPPRRDFIPPGRRGDGMPPGPRGYDSEEAFGSLPPGRDFGPDNVVPPPRRRSPDPRYNYRAPPKGGYPARGGWYRGPSPNRWN